MSNDNSDISYNLDISYNSDPNIDNSDTTVNNSDNVDNSESNIDNSQEIQLYDITYVPLIYTPNYNCSNILLIDSTVEDYQTIVDSVNSNTMAIVYSYLSTKEDLSMVLSNFTNISRIGFAFCSNDNDCPVIFLDNQPFFSFDLFHVDFDCENILFLKEIFQKYNIQYADYLACNTLNYWQWNTYYNILMENTNTTIAASDDKTGNVKYGGDWVLESNSEDIEQIYFTENIQYYNYLLDNAT